MGIAILLLGLLPLAFLPDFLDSNSEGDDENSEDLDSSSGPGDLLDEGGGSGDGSHWSPDILNPVVEDDFDENDDDDPDEDSILAPVDGDDDATPSDGEEGDVLAPIVEDDVANRAGEAEENAPTFSSDLDANTKAEYSDNLLDAKGVDQEPVNIENFQAGEDVLFISVDPEDDKEALEVATKPSDNGQDGLVFVGGKLVAVIEDTPNASAQDIIIDVIPGNR